MKKNTFNTTVPIESDKLRIDKFLQLKLKELSRTKLQELIESKQVYLNNQIITNSSKKIKEKDEIIVNFPPKKKRI